MLFLTELIKFPDLTSNIEILLEKYNLQLDNGDLININVSELKDAFYAINTILEVYNNLETKDFYAKTIANDQEKIIQKQQITNKINYETYEKIQKIQNIAETLRGKTPKVINDEKIKLLNFLNRLNELKQNSTFIEHQISLLKRQKKHNNEMMTSTKNKLEKAEIEQDEDVKGEYYDIYDIYERLISEIKYSKNLINVISRDTDNLLEFYEEKLKKLF